MDAADIAEKATRKKAPAADTEQPEKKVKQNWNSVDLSRALLKFRLSAAALKVALCVHSHQGFCKTGWNGHYLFHEKHMQEETGFVKDGEEKKIRQGLKDLVSVNAIEEPERIRVKGKWRGKVIKWNFDYSSWGRKNEPEEILPEENPPVENPPEEKLPEENPPVIRIIHNRKDYTDPEDYTESPKDCTGFKDCTRGEDCTEGAAAKPQPAPALPEGAENVPEESAAQNTPGEAASQGSSNTETAHGVPERAPETKPKKPKKTKKPKKPKDEPQEEEEIEIPEVEEIKICIAGYIQKNYEQGIHNYTWTQWELTETAKDIQAAIPKYKWKDWRQGARNWIRNNKPVAFKPKMTDPTRYTWNQPPGQTFQQGQQELFYERISGLVESGAATLEGVLKGFGITDPEDVRRIGNEIARRRGNSAAL